jgi:hypothetical protein
MRLFILNSVTTQDFDNLEVDVYRDDQEFVPSETANKATGYFHKVARLLLRVKNFLNQNTATEAKDTVAELIHTGESLDKGMTDWSKDEPGWDMMNVRAATNGTMWALYPAHAKYYLYSFWVFLYWLRFLSARFKLYEGLIELARFGHQQATGERRLSQTSHQKQLSVYVEHMRTTANELIGLTAYALGDVTTTGDFNSSVSGLNPRQGFQEINVVAAMQLVLPLKMLQRSEHMTSIQKGAVDLAISHIGDGFRRQPVTYN